MPIQSSHRQAGVPLVQLAAIVKLMVIGSLTMYGPVCPSGTPMTGNRAHVG